MVLGVEGLKEIYVYWSERKGIGKPQNGRRDVPRDGDGLLAGKDA
jgi:hypothetical protein